jgi:hypothetical protein
MWKHFAIAFLAGSAVCSGGTAYSGSGNVLPWSGGAWDRKGPGELIKVGFVGNYVNDDRQLAEQFLLYHCAQVAQREGKNYFALYDNLPNAVSDVRSTSKATGTVAGHARAYAYILLFDGPGRSLLSTQELLTRLGPVVGPGHSP